MSKRKAVIISDWQPHIDKMMELMNEKLELPNEARIEWAKDRVFGEMFVPFAFHLDQGQLRVDGVVDHIYFHDPIGFGQDVEFIDPPGFERLVGGIVEVKNLKVGIS